MSAILDKLLKGQNVEWHTIEQIFHLRNGYTPSKSNEAYWTNGTIPWFRMEDIRENGNILDSALQQISESAVKGNKLFPKNSFIIATSATIGEHALITVPYLANQRFTNLSLKDDFINRFNIYFLYYYLFKLDEWCRNNTTMSSFASVDMNGFRKFEIPIPPLDVQDEIARILDAFTAVTAELTAELNMREKQYQYYRDKLLTFSDNEIIWKSLGELGQLIRGNGLQKSDFTEDGFPAIHYGQIYTFYGKFADKTKSFVSENLAKKLKKAQNGDVLLAGTSENIQDVMKPLGWLGDEIAISGDMFAYRPNTELDTKYLTYLLQTTEFQKYKEKYAHGTKVTRLNAEKFLRFEIAIPPLNEQKRIANILDKFEALTHSITEGLPKEITLREQQYEYYREQLIDFPKN
nr:restriction endonuclease subunit S [Moraxella sp.]